MKSIVNSMRQTLEKRANMGLLRSLKSNNGLIDFCSNDYLGFARNKDIYQRAEAILQNSEMFNYSGSTGSRLISGNNQFVENLEQKIALIHKSEAALIFNSGYDANIGLFSSLPQKSDTVYYDELIHASIRDGIRLSYASSFSFRHNNLDDLVSKLTHASGKIFIAVESVYSMDGDQAPLVELISICERYGAILIVDEAHATGVFGDKGYGICEKLNLQHKVFARVHTFGKALGCHGAVVLGCKDLRNYLINFSRSFIYTTSLPLHSLAIIDAAYEKLNNSEKERMILKENIEYFNKVAMNLKSCKFIPSESAIHCMITPGNQRTSECARYIQSKGFDVRPILSPTVPKGYERLRICLHTFNNKEEIDALMQIISEFV